MAPTPYSTLLRNSASIKNWFRCITVVLSSCCSSRIKLNALFLHARQTRRHGKAFRGHAPRITACPPQTRIVLPPSEDCAPKKLTGSVLVVCSSRPETPKRLGRTPKFVSKNCFFVDFAIVTVCFCGYTPKFMVIRTVFGIKLFFCLYLMFCRILQ